MNVQEGMLSCTMYRYHIHDIYRYMYVCSSYVHMCTCSMLSCMCAHTHDIHVCMCTCTTYTVPLVTKQIKMYFLLRRQLKILIAKEQLQQQ